MDDYDDDDDDDDNDDNKNTVAVCTDLRGNDLHRQVGMGTVVTSGSLCGEMVAHWPEIWVQFLL